MKFPSLPFLKKKDIYSYFLVLILRNEKANAVVFEELEGKIKVIGQHTEHFSKSIEETTLDEMLEVLDKAISTAEETLPKNIETHKTIFGVKEDWVEKDKIKQHYLIKLKKVSDQLELTPIGFIIISQAVSHLLQKEEGAPVSAILVELGSKNLTVSLIRAGRIIETKSSEIHESIPYTVDTLLKHFQTSEILPSRIILFDGDQDLSQEFLSHSWSKSLPFLHLPQIAALPSNFDARAVLFGAATQMGFDLLQEENQKIEIVEKSNKPIQEKNPQKEKSQEIILEENYITPEEFGFIPIKSETSNENYVHETPGNDEKKEESVTPQTKDPDSKISKTSIPLGIIKTIFSKLFIVLKKLKFIKKLRFKLPMSKNGKNKLLIPIILIVILLLGFFVFYLFGTKTEIVLNIKPRVVEQNKDVVFSTSPSTSPSELNIVGEEVSISEEGTASANATGKKEIGTSAKGKVTIFNNNINEINLSSGTKITSSNGLSFTLDDAIKIASASSDPFEGIKPSKKDANVSASSIGQTYNLPSGTKFSIEDDPLIAAKNDTPFSGGTKKEVTVVSKKDIDNLIADLPKTLEEKAKSDLTHKIEKDKSLIPIFTKTDIIDKKLNKKQGEEANKVTLTATISYIGLSYSKNDLYSLAQSLIKDSVPNNLTAKKENITVDMKEAKLKEKSITASINIKALLEPTIDENELRSSLSGKSYNNAKTLLLKIPQADNAEISFKPNIPFLPKFISRNSKNIKITVKLNE